MVNYISSDEVREVVAFTGERRSVVELFDVMVARRHQSVGVRLAVGRLMADRSDE
jgi:hypothetical protein